MTAFASPALNPLEGRRRRLGDGLSWHLVLLLFVFGGSLLLIGLGDSRVLTYHEMLFAQPAREMLAGGDWLIPKVAGEPSLHKPPGMHWAIAVFMKATGSESEFVVRLPSVLASLATAWLVGVLAARRLGAGVGLLAGLIQLTTIATLMQGRMAEADALLTFAVSGAMAALFVANEPGRQVVAQDRSSWLGRLWPALAFHGCMALAFMTKGLIGPAMIGVSAGLYLLWVREWRVLCFLLNPFGLMILAIGVLAWPMAAYQAYPPILDAWRHHHLDRFQGSLGGGKPPFFYFYVVPLLLLPWTPFAIAGIRALTRGRGDELARLLVCWFVPGFLLLCASSFKHKHYVIPLLPALSILAALGLERFVSNPRLLGHCGKLALLVVAGCGVGLTVIWSVKLADAQAVSLLIVIAGAGMLTATYLAHRRQPIRQLAVLFATVWLAAVTAQVLILPRHDSYRAQAQLAARVNQTVPNDAPLYLLGLPENQITSYLSPSLVRIDLPADVQANLRAWASAADGTSRYALAPQFLLPMLREWTLVEVVDRCETINRYSTEQNRLLFVRVERR